MKKKLLFSICLVCFILATVGCGNESKDSDTVILSNEAINETESSEAPSEVENIVSNPDGIDFEELPDDMKGLIIPIDSLLLYHIENGGEYLPENPEMFWQVMHYAIVNFGEFYNRAELVESELAADSMVIGEFASAIIADLEEIPSIPDSLSYGVRYDSEEDLYFFGVGDRGLSQTEILSYEYIDNNTLKIRARLFAMDDDSTILEGDFVLVRNEYAAGVIEPLFYFSVSEATFVEE